MTEIEYELYHHGIKGMKWGKRKTRKWATAKHQPSSARSSALAGLYAATRNERIGKALDKSNARDAENWQRAKEEYANRANANNNKGRLTDTQKKKLRVGAAVTATALAAYGGYKVNDWLNSCSYTVDGKSVSRKEFVAAIKAAVGIYS